MEHFEHMYLMQAAGYVRKLIESAEKRGSFFNVSDNFCELKSGCRAQAQIRKINPEDTGPALILRVRGSRELATKEAQSFFVGPFNTVPGYVESPHGQEFVFWNHDVPKALTFDEFEEKANGECT